MVALLGPTVSRLVSKEPSDIRTPKILERYHEPSRCGVNFLLFKSNMSILKPKIVVFEAKIFSEITTHTGIRKQWLANRRRHHSITFSSVERTPFVIRKSIR